MYWPKIVFIDFVLIAFKMVKMEFKFMYAILINESVNHFSQVTSVKAKKNLRKS